MTETSTGQSLQDFNSTEEMDNSVSQKPTTSPRWLLLGLIAIPIWILTGNILVLLALFFNKNLRTLSNWVVGSLAGTDFLVAVAVVPLAGYHVINGRWDLGFIPCLIWTGSDVFLSTASILHLVAIAIHRYLGISHPLHFRNHADKRQIAALLIPAWLVSLVITLPLIVQGLRDERHVLQHVPGLGPQCGIFDPTFAIYSSTVSFFVPLGIMLFADVGSVYALRQTGKVSQRNQNIRRSKSQYITNGTGGKGYKLASSDGLSESGNNTKVRQQQVVYIQGKVTRGNTDSNFISATAVSVSYSETSSINGELPTSGPPIPHRKSSRFTGFSRSSTVRTRTQKVNSREKRAEKTLIWVFVCFIALWLPFFCTNLAYGCCPSCDIPSTIFVTFTWLGYISSGVNPCIYTFLNKDFRNAFKRIIFCRKNGK